MIILHSHHLFVSNNLADQVPIVWMNHLEYLFLLSPTKTLLENCLVWFTIELFSANSFLEKDIVVLGQVFSLDMFCIVFSQNWSLWKNLAFPWHLQLLVFYKWCFWFKLDVYNILISCACIPLREGIRILESRQFLPVKTGILGFGIMNTAQGIQNPTND